MGPPGFEPGATGSRVAIIFMTRYVIGSSRLFYRNS